MSDYLHTLLFTREACIKGIRNGGIHPANEYRDMLHLMRRLIHQEIMAIRRGKRG